ncbi:MAG: hypothetical protein QNJ54_31595 [Prochloraceae cyanobacterium]|nr:hypothetical protein [Prochloraceae cyanobacterium]
MEFKHWSATVAKLMIIDLIRKEKLFFDRSVSGTNLPLVETVPEGLESIDSLKRADLILKIRNIVLNLDKRFPKKQYLRLYKGLSQGKKITQIAKEQGITQGAMSKRKWELVQLIAQELELFPIENLKKQLKNQTESRKIRQRSQQKW